MTITPSNSRVNRVWPANVEARDSKLSMNENIESGKAHDRGMWFRAQEWWAVFECTSQAIAFGGESQ